MNKLDEFKNFVKENPRLLDKIQANEVSWQQLYETYDIYGASHPLFGNSKINVTPQTNQSRQSPDHLKNALSFFEKIDMDKLSQNLQSIKKVIGAIGEITSINDSKKEVATPSPSKKNTYKRYND